MYSRLIEGIVFLGMGLSSFLFPITIARWLTGFQARVLPRPVTVRPLSMVLAGAVFLFWGACWFAWSTT